MFAFDLERTSAFRLKFSWWHRGKLMKKLFSLNWGKPKQEDADLELAEPLDQAVVARINTDFARLVHYLEDDDELVLVRRGSQ